jgi:hypothetical protein
VSTSKGMVRVLGTTYRITEIAGTHEIVRLHDDAPVGSFRYGPMLTILESSIEPRLLAGVVRAALQGGKLRWRPAVRPRLTTKLRALLANAAGLFARLPRLLAPLPVPLVFEDHFIRIDQRTSK